MTALTEQQRIWAITALVADHQFVKNHDLQQQRDQARLDISPGLIAVLCDVGRDVVNAAWANGAELALELGLE